MDESFLSYNLVILIDFYVLIVGCSMDESLLCYNFGI